MAMQLTGESMRLLATGSEYGIVSAAIHPIDLELSLSAIPIGADPLIGMVMMVTGTMVFTSCLVVRRYYGLA